MGIPVSEELCRRRFLTCFASMGLSSTLLPGVLWATAHERQEPRITKAILQEAEKVAGVRLTEAQRDLILRGLNQNLEHFEALRRIPIDNALQPALRFSPILPGM